jgi:hypothetical protein
MKAQVIAALCGVSVIVSACSQSPQVVADGNSSAGGESDGIFKAAGGKVAQTCEGGGIVTNDEFSVNGSVDLRSKPSNSADKIVNEKATSILHTTEYQQVDYSERLKEVCRQKDWSKIQVLEPDWLTHVTGWVPVKALRAIQRDSSGKRTYVEADFSWDKDSEAFKPKLVAAVNRIVRENARCPIVDPGTLSKSGPRSKLGKPVFYVTCQGEQPFNVWFEPSDAADTGKSFAAIRNVDRGGAVQLCQQAAKEAANNPQTVSFSKFMDLAFVPYANGNTRVISSFTAKNAFGVESKFRIECFFEGSTMTERIIEEDRS